MGFGPLSLLTPLATLKHGHPESPRCSALLHNIFSSTMIKNPTRMALLDTEDRNRPLVKQAPLSKSDIFAQNRDVLQLSRCVVLYARMRMTSASASSVKRKKRQGRLPDHWKAVPGARASRRRSCLTRSIWVESLSNAFLAPTKSPAFAEISNCFAASCAAEA